MFTVSSRTGSSQPVKFTRISIGDFLTCAKWFRLLFGARHMYRGNSTFLRFKPCEDVWVLAHSWVSMCLVRFRCSFCFVCVLRITLAPRTRIALVFHTVNRENKPKCHKCELNRPMWTDFSSSFFISCNLFIYFIIVCASPGPETRQFYYIFVFVA